MNRSGHGTPKAGMVSGIVVLIGFSMAGTGYAQHNHTMPRSTPQRRTTATSPKARPSTQAPASKQLPGAVPQQASPKPEDSSLHAIHAKQVPAVQEALARAIQHLEAGRSQEALREMRQMRLSLDALHEALGRHVGPRFLNDRCPIMGAKIDPDKVPAELTRDYGQGKVAFCCAGCPDQWDRLTDAEKAAKLKSVAVAPQPMHQGMMNQGMMRRGMMNGGMMNQGMMHEGMQH